MDWFLPSQTMAQTCGGISVSTPSPIEKALNIHTFSVENLAQSGNCFIWEIWPFMGQILIQEIQLQWSQNWMQGPTCQEKHQQLLVGSPTGTLSAAQPADQGRTRGSLPVPGLCLCFAQMQRSLDRVLLHLTLYKMNVICLSRARQRDEFHHLVKLFKWLTAGNSWSLLWPVLPMVSCCFCFLRAGNYASLRWLMLCSSAALMCLAIFLKLFCGGIFFFPFKSSLFMSLSALIGFDPYSKLEDMALSSNCL